MELKAVVLGAEPQEQVVCPLVQEVQESIQPGPLPLRSPTVCALAVLEPVLSTPCRPL